MLQVRLHGTLVKALSASAGEIPITHVPHLKAGRIELKLIEKVEGSSHDLIHVLVARLYGSQLIS